MQVKQQIKKAKSAGETILTCTFATMDKMSMHPQKGTPILYHDQLDVVAKHLTEIKLKDEERNRKHQKYI